MTVLVAINVVLGLIATVTEPRQIVIEEGVAQQGWNVWGLVALPFALASLVVALVWVFRVASNAQRLRGDGKPSPGWAVGSWFIPLANIVLPIFPMRDTARATQAGGLAVAWGSAWAGYMLGTYVVGAWGGVFGVLQGIEHAETSAVTVDLPTGLVVLQWLVQALALAAGALWLLLAWRLQDGQEAARTGPTSRTGHEAA